MQDVNYWKQFENTGKVEDYLSYCTCVLEDAGREWNTSAMEARQAGWTGGNPYAGIPMCNRNDIETDAYRGI